MKAYRTPDGLEEPLYRTLVYVDPDEQQRQFADAVLRGDFAVESAASIEDLGASIEAAVVVVNLSEVSDPASIWDTLTERWPSIPVVVVLTPESRTGLDRKDVWTMGAASIVVNPLASGALRGAVSAAVS